MRIIFDRRRDMGKNKSNLDSFTYGLFAWDPMTCN